MTVSSQDYASLSAAAYKNGMLKDTERVNGKIFEVIDIGASPLTGFRATAYRDKKTGETIISYRGTQAFDDGLVDLGMVATEVNAQRFESIAFTQHVMETAEDYASKSGRPMNVTVTGHSLGGSLAEINAAHFGLRGETFNAYGAVGLDRDATEGGERVINHARALDPISAANRHHGSVEIYATPDDIATLKKTGYEHGHGAIHAIRSLDLKSHAISNFIPDAQGRSLLDTENVERYRSHKDMVDQYRSDVLTARSIATAAFDNPQSMAVAVGATLAQAYVERIKNEASTISRIATTVADHGHEINAGMHASAFSSSSMRGAWTALPQPDHPAIARLDDPSHLGNTLFKQALEGTQRLDAAQGRTPDKLSTNLAGSLAVEAQRKGMDRIDHVVLSDDASRAYAVQGELSSPFKKIAEVQTELGISASIDQSSKAWPQATEQRQQEAMAQSMERASPAALDTAQPTMGRTLH